MQSKRIFAFWEPRTNLPPYLKLCMQTWKKFLPEYEIVILDYSNLDEWLGKDFFDSILFQRFSLPKQADAIRCAVLKKYGGIWMDCDTIITSEKVRDFLTIESSFVLIGTHIGFISATPDSSVLDKWLRGIHFRLKLYKKRYPNSKFARILLWLKSPRKYKRNVRKVKKLNDWDFTGNGVLNSVLEKTKNSKEFFSVDRLTNNIFPELTEYGNMSAEIYRKFYFQNDFSEKALENTHGIIMLHNSWTPPEYLTMSKEEFLSQNNTLSNLLKKIID